MPYLNLDDNYPDHPKVAALTDAAYRLHGAAMVYVARYRLDGYLTTEQLRSRARWSKKTQGELTAVGLVHEPGEPCTSETCPADDGTSWRLHDYFQWNKSRAWWDEQKQSTAQRQAEWRERQAAAKEKKRRESGGDA